jgi:hypothetical protein
MHRTKPCAGHLASATVHSKLEVLAVEMIRNRVQTIRKLVVVDLQFSFFVPSFGILPAVVQDNIVVPKITQTKAYDLF